jgi:c-di-GMP-binding flagellar brake protein YcgR
MPTKPARRRNDRRRKPRADARLSMRVEGTHQGETAQIVTESQNISASGVYCTAANFLPPMSRVALTIVLPRVPGGRGTKELIKCDGIVVRCEPVAKRSDKRWELACMFSGLDERRRGQIEEFVTWRNLQSLRAAARAATGPVRRKKAATKRPAVVKTAARKKAAARR